MTPWYAQDTQISIENSTLLHSSEISFVMSKKCLYCHTHGYRYPRAPEMAQLESKNECFNSKVRRKRTQAEKKQADLPEQIIKITAGTSFP